MPSVSFNSKLCSFALVALLASSACDSGVLPEQRDVVWFTAVETDQFAPRPYEDQRTALSDAQINQLQPIVNDFIANHERLFDDAEVVRQIERIEDVFMAFGRFHELIPLYRKDYEQKGPASFVAPRLAWAYIRLGQRDLARQTLDALLAGKPNDPLVHFMDGAFWVQSEPRGEDALKKAVLAWKRTLELDPTFRGPEGLDATVLRQELDRFEQQVGPVEPTDPVVSARGRVGGAVVVSVATANVAAAPDGPLVRRPEQPQPPAEQPEQPSEAPTTEPQVEDARPLSDMAPSQPSMNENQRYRVLVARAQIEMSNGNSQAAEDLFLQAKALKPDGFAAEFGHLRSGWSVTSARNNIATKMRALAERTDLDPQQRYELGLFVWSKMDRGDIALKLWKSIPEEDPELAKRVDLATLMERAK